MGQGTLEHERAYLKWLEGVWMRYPDLIIENCSSGGLRMDYAMLSRYSIQSTSDQDDYRLYATIAANAPTAVTPEQAAVWAYPMNHEEEISQRELKEETVFNMVNAMLLRIHQSGHLAKLDEMRFGLKCGEKRYLAVWRRCGQKETMDLPIPELKGVDVTVDRIYPSYAQEAFAWNRNLGSLTVQLPEEYTARLFELRI